jgi:predicted nucleotide-binding protein
MNAIGELVELADRIGADRQALDAKHEEFGLLRRSAEEVGRAWSGSNLGYQARVYYQEFLPVPAGVVFSVEWGLEERWPLHTPDQGWHIFAEPAVHAEVLARAGGLDVASLATVLERQARQFRAHADTLASLLSTSIKATGDDFLRKRLGDVEAFGDLPNPQTIAAHLVPNGQIMTRDTTALGGGRHPAPHQRLLGLARSYEVAHGAFDDLERLAKLTAAHLARLQPDGRTGVQTGGAVTFIGHGRSLVWRELKDFLQERLGLAVSEFNSVSPAGVATVNRLQEMLDTAAFAFLIMTGEDEQPDGQVQARQNVIHEVGLFQGRLGFGKAIILLEEGCADFSNIHGLGYLPFQKGRVSSCFEEVRKVLEREKILKP